MIIQRVPALFQPTYNSQYPVYNSGKHMEEMLFRYFSTNHREIKTNYVYLPVYWTSYYMLGKDLEVLKTWLHKLDKSKKYLTVVQNDCGIYVNDYNLNITVCGPSGGLSFKDTCLENNMYNGKTPSIILPYLCTPMIPKRSMEKDILCSFIGTQNNIYTDVLKDISGVQYFPDAGPEETCDILNRSTFTLTPRDIGYGSFRMYEAITCGCIPIYIWNGENPLPYSEKINWGAMCIMLHINNISVIMDKIKRAHVDNMQKNLAQNLKFFNFDAAFDYLRWKIEKK